jgi:hypothetical protein
MNEACAVDGEIPYFADAVEMAPLMRIPARINALARVDAPWLAG